MLEARADEFNKIFAGHFTFGVDKRDGVFAAKMAGGSFPNPQRRAFRFHEGMTARAASGILPGLDGVFRGDRTGQFYFVPFKPARFGGPGGEQTVPQDDRRNFQRFEGGKCAGKFPVPDDAAHARKNVE
jgi:hypothetical protein